MVLLPMVLLGLVISIFLLQSNLLHQHLNYNRSNYHQFTNSFTGNLASDGLLMGLTFNPVNLPQQPVNKFISGHSNARIGTHTILHLAILQTILYPKD